MMLRPARPTILIVNPNTSEAVTGWLVGEARRAADGACDFIAINAPSGVGAIQTPEELAQAAAAVVKAIGRYPDVDGIIIAAFGDPGLASAREQEAKRALARPVVGLAASGLIAAGAGGRRFSIATMGAAMTGDVTARVASLGLSSQLAGLHIMPVAIPDLIADRDGKRAIIVETVRRCVEEDGAEAVLLGGAPLAGLAAGIADETGLVVLDGVAASVAACLQQLA